MRSRQEAFDIAVRAVLQQGKPSMNGPTSCCYRGPDGTKCAIGHLIADKDYHRDWDRKARSANHKPICMAAGLPGDATFLLALQRCHDTNADSHAFITLFKADARRLANIYKLDASCVG